MEVDLHRLKRFDKDKHEQLEGLLQWCQLMGLSGKDLVSLGGHIDRMDRTRQAKLNKEIVNSYSCKLVGNDSNMNERFSLKTSNGRYRFESDGWGRVRITSYKTKASKNFNPSKYEIGRMYWRAAWRYHVLLDVHAGVIQLNF